MKASMVAMSILASEGWSESGFKIHNKGFSYDFGKLHTKHRASTIRYAPPEIKKSHKYRNKKGRP